MVRYVTDRSETCSSRGIAFHRYATSAMRDDAGKENGCIIWQEGTWQLFFLAKPVVAKPASKFIEVNTGVVNKQLLTGWLLTWMLKMALMHPLMFAARKESSR